MHAFAANDIISTPCFQFLSLHQVLTCSVLQSFIIDLHEKMTGISIYGVVLDILREANTAKTVFNLKIQDPTGTICIKLHLSESWYCQSLFGPMKC